MIKSSPIFLLSLVMDATVVSRDTKCLRRTKKITIVASADGTVDKR